MSETWLVLFKMLFVVLAYSVGVYMGIRQERAKHG